MCRIERRTRLNLQKTWILFLKAMITISFLKTNNQKTMDKALFLYNSSMYFHLKRNNRSIWVFVDVHCMLIWPGISHAQKNLQKYNYHYGDTSLKSLMTWSNSSSLWVSSTSVFLESLNTFNYTFQCRVKKRK